MTMNKWTVGLAAAGLLGLSSVAQAQVATKLATTSLSGYVSTAYQWNLGDTAPGYTGFAQSGKKDRFALDVVSLSIGSPVAPAATGWAAGYNVQLWAGPDAGDLATDSTDATADFAVKQAYVAMRAPVGKGINIKLGVFNTILGRDDADRNVNTHYSHSLAWTHLEPSQHTGLTASYQLHENVGVTALLANTRDPKINATGDSGSEDDRKTWGVALALTAPASFGFLKGAALDAAYINGHSKDAGASTAQELVNYYLNASIPTPIKNLTTAVSWDILNRSGKGNDDSVLGLHLKYKVSDKLNVAARVEIAQLQTAELSGVAGEDAVDYTLTASYDLFANVITRLEYRYTDLKGKATSEKENTSALFVNVIYQF